MRNEDDASLGCTKSPAGDSYPARAGWAAHLIDQPYSAVNTEIPVVGVVRAEGTDTTFEFTPGGGYWTEQARQRLTELNAPPWARAVDNHLEMQVAAWMVRTDTRNVELVINREPCGERYYSHDYDGKAC